MSFISSHSIRFGSLVALVAALALFSLSPAPPAHATSITVTTTTDELNADGDCSLREAIQAANTDAVVSGCSAGSGADTVNVPEGAYTLTIPGAGEDNNATGDLDVRSDLILAGAGPSTVLQACDSTHGSCVGIDRVLEAFYLTTVTAQDIVVQNGDATSEPGGGIKQHAAGTLTVINSTIRGNSAGTGGGIESAGTLNLFDSFVLNNTASEGGGLGGSGTFVIDGTVFSRNNAVVAGGGILVTYYGAITMTSSVLSDNHATDGGGILTGGAAALIASSITGNTATIGGGISNWTALTLEGTTVSGNTAAVGGGIASDYSMTISNSTVSGNTASVGGGGIFNNEYTNLSMYNSTVSANSASLGAGLLYDSSPNRVILKNTIFAYNGSQNCATEFYAGSLNSYGYNISSDTSCTLTGHADRTNTDPLLGPLADNGGPNQTHALLAGSPAIDAGSPDCPPPTADQRGAPRPYDGDDDATAVCDIGAFEYQGELPPTPTASPTPTPPSIGGISLNPASASGGGFDAWLLIIGLVSAGAIAAAGALSLIAMRRA